MSKLNNQCSRCQANITKRGYTNVPGVGDLCISCHGQWLHAMKQPVPDLWSLIDPPPPPTCDLCDRLAIYVHPAGGFRCKKCPRPTT